MQERSSAQDNSSPTTSTESLFLLSCVFAAEKRHVVTVDIEGAYLHGIMTGDVYMQIEGKCVDVLRHSYSSIYKKYIRNNRLYVRLSRALYGTMIHVDDLMVACRDRKGVEHVIDFLSKEYTKENVYEGSNLDYLGMLFTFKPNGQVTIDMSSMVNEFLKELEVHDEARARTPAAMHLFNINSKADFHVMLSVRNSIRWWRKGYI